jgi:hypothetical protein
MEYLHREFNLAEGDTIEVTLSGNAANVLLLDEDNFQNYVQGKPYTYAAGGYARFTPYRIEAPRAGKWHLVVDLAGGAGRVSASTRVISASTSVKEAF